MNRRSERLKPAQQQAARREREAAVRLVELGRAVELAKSRLGELQQWEREYAERLHSGTMTRDDLMDYRLFLQRLADAGEAQRRVLVEAERAFDSGREAWLGLHARHEAICQVVVRYEEESTREAARREQHATDEFAANNMRNRDGRYDR